MVGKKYLRVGPFAMIAFRESRARDTTSSAAVANALTGMRILIIEDIWLVAQSYVGLFELLGVVVVGPASTIAEALALIEVERIDAALVDMNLHGEMADGLVEALNARGVPVVVATGYDTVPGLEGKVSAFLKKPIRAEALVKAMREIAATH